MSDYAFALNQRVKMPILDVEGIVVSRGEDVASGRFYSVKAIGHNRREMTLTFGEAEFEAAKPARAEPNRATKGWITRRKNAAKIKRKR